MDRDVHWENDMLKKKKEETEEIIDSKITSFI
jgi:hypothetical protein